MCEAPFQLSHLVDIEAQLRRELPKEDIFICQTRDNQSISKGNLNAGQTNELYFGEKLRNQSNWNWFAAALIEIKGRIWLSCVLCWILNFWCIFQWFAVRHCFVFLDTFDNTQCVLHTQSFRIDNYEEEIMKSKYKLMVFWRKKGLGGNLYGVFSGLKKPSSHWMAPFD